MKTIISGCRYMKDYSLIERAITMSGFEITEVISGHTKGIALLGERWAIEHKIKLTKMAADWQGSGKRAGPYRNEAMAMHGDALIAVWDFQCWRTRKIIRLATEHGLKVFVPNFPEWPVWREVDDKGRPVLFVREGTVTIRFIIEEEPKAALKSQREVIAIYFEGVPGREREVRHQYCFLTNGFEAASIHPILEDYQEHLITWCCEVKKAPYTGPMKADCLPQLLPETGAVPTVLFICGREPLTRAQRQALPLAKEICDFDRACFPLRKEGINLMIEAIQPTLQAGSCDIRHGRVQVSGEEVRFISGGKDFRVSSICAAVPDGVAFSECLRSNRIQEYASRVPLWWLSPEGRWFPTGDTKGE